MFMQVVVHLCLDEITHILIHADTTRTHCLRTQFDLRLTLEHRFFHIHGNGCYQSVTDIAVFQVLIKILLDGTGDMLLESRLVCSTLCGMLTVYERMVFLAILIGVREGNLYILPFHMDNRIDAIHGHIIIQQILQTVTAEDSPTVVHNDQTRIQIGVVTEHDLHEIIVEGIVLEQGVVRLEINKCAGFIGRCGSGIALQFAPFEGSAAHLSVTETLHDEMRAQGIDGFQSDTIQTDTLLKSLRVVLTTGVQHTDSLNQFALRNATTIVAHGNAEIIFDVYLYPLAGIHLKLIDGVVDNFLQQHIDTVLGHRAVTQTTDIHTGACTHMLHVRQMLDVIVYILYRFLYFRILILYLAH